MKPEAEAVMPTRGTIEALRKTLDIDGRLKRNPYGMVAGALGAGFVLGGGLFTRFSARILGAGLRVGLMAALPILEKMFRQALADSKTETKRMENER
jgi:hypothetical protein